MQTKEQIMSGVNDYVNSLDNIFHSLGRKQTSLSNLPAFIEENFIFDTITNDKLNEQLTNYVTKDELADELLFYIKSTGADFETSTTGDYIRGYVTKMLGPYETKEATENWVLSTVNTKLQDYYTKSNVDNIISNLHIDLYATKSWVENKILEIADNDGTISIELEGYGTKDWILANFYTKGQIDTKVSNLVTTGTFNSTISNYVTKTALSNMSYITAAQVDTKIANAVTAGIDMSKYMLKSDAANHATVDYVNNKVNQINISNYYTRSETNALITQRITDQFTKDEEGNVVISLDGYATEEWATNTFQPKGNYLTSHQSLANYYTKSESNNNFITASKLAQYGYATEEFVKGYFDATFENVNLDDVALTNYVKKDEVDNYISTYLDNNNIGEIDTTLYYTKVEVDAKLGDINTILENILS